MKVEIQIATTQAITEWWQVELEDDVNIKDFITAIEEDVSIIFNESHPAQKGYAMLVDSENYDTISNVIESVTIKETKR